MMNQNTPEKFTFSLKLNKAFPHEKMPKQVYLLRHFEAFIFLSGNEPRQIVQGPILLRDECFLMYVDTTLNSQNLHLLLLDSSHSSIVQGIRPLLRINVLPVTLHLRRLH